MFSTISEEDLKALDHDKGSKNTKRVFKHDVNLFNEFLLSNDMDLGDLVENPAEINNQHIRKRRGTKEKIFGQYEVLNFQASLKHVHV
ncbi:hypothetical protein DPMN_193358 [Dreissena polymorpha]|uniref:Uncharacterized protein n=1 Tax=Dreissena polymorpha TaxID=45954 RepID=A0A9D3Y706_DREPO|nr:hypothetical protein DPMN_193358 [Dreissena polymorpha]